MAMAGSVQARKMLANIKDPQHCKRMVVSLQSFNVQNNFKDLCFVCARGIKVYTHKLFLCSVSTQMKEILLEVPESIKVITIHLPDIEARMLRLLFDFLYEGVVRVNQDEYNNFQDVMSLLGIVLTTPNLNSLQETVNQTSQPPPQPPPPPQAPQLVYVPVPPNSQGQVQYMLASPAPLAQGQMLIPPAVQPSPQPMMMSQAGVQMVQTGSGHLVTGQVQQLQMVQQNNTQVVPMVAGNTNQIVSGNQIAQCSNDMVAQGNQQAMMNNNKMQVSMQNQVVQSNYSSNQTVQQRPQYVMSSASRQPTTSTRASAQYSHPPTVTPQTQRGRLKSTQQRTTTSQVTSVRTRRLMRASVPVTQPHSGTVRTNQRSQRGRLLTQ